MQDFKLNDAQKRAYDYMVQGENVFLTGPGGVGKSVVINTFKKAVEGKKNIAITSTTGVSALLIGGTTLHSYLGIGLGKGTVDDLVAAIKRNKQAKQRWMELEILVIDEVSMLSADLFDKLERIAGLIRKGGPSLLAKKSTDEKEAPFGGIQLILSGDFLQLPVVGNENTFCFEAKSWNKCIKHTIELTEIMRQKDVEFQTFLNHIRHGEVNDEDEDILQECLDREIVNDLGIKPTRIYTTNASVDKINEQELKKISKNNDVYEYDMEVEFHQHVPNVRDTIEKFQKNCLAPVHLELCVGAQVMLLVNLSLDVGLANGSRGIVKSFDPDGLPVVLFLNGIEVPIGFYEWKIEGEKNKTLATFTQLPLKLAWAITVHKCVGSETIVYTQGGMCKIKDLANGVLLPCCSVNPIRMGIHGVRGIETATQLYKGKIEPTIRIRTFLGYELEGSYRHPILVKNGYGVTWKKMPYLKHFEKVELDCSTGCFGQEFSVTLPSGRIVNIDHRICYLLGIFDDTCSAMLTFEQYDKVSSIFEDVFQEKLVKTVFANLIAVTIRLESEVRNLFVWAGLSVSPNVPWAVLRNDRKGQIAFIQALYDVNGIVIPAKVILNTRFASTVQLILLNLGLKTKRRFENITVDLKSFEDVIYREKILPNRKIFDKIISIKSGRTLLYDLYVPDSHTFIGNGFVNHNSQGMSLDCAELDLTNLFVCGQAYVALSRVRCKEGLKLLNVDVSSIKAHPKALEYYDTVSRSL